MLIADRDRAVRKHLRLVIEQARDISVIGEASNGADAVTIAVSECADVVMMSLHLEHMSGVQATQELTSRSVANRSVAVIAVASREADDLVVEALVAGAIGHLLTSCDSDQILPAIRAAARGQAFVSPRVTFSILRELRRQTPKLRRGDPAAELTVAEQRVVSMLSSGITSNEGIAEELHLSVHTVRSQLQSAMRKAGVDDRTQLALWAIRDSVHSHPTPSA